MKNLILIALLQVFLIGCGGDGSSDSDDSSGTTSGSETGDTGGSGSVSSNIPTIGSCNVSAEQEELFNAHNAARAVTQDCGSEGVKPSAPPLEWHCLLAESSLVHSEDMADNDFFNHTGSDGLSAVNRINNVGYDNYNAAGENIIAGYPSIDASMAGWLASDGHCGNIMNSDFTEMGAAVVTSTTAQYDNYITANFGRRF